MVIGKINSVFAKHHRWMFGAIVMVVIVTFVLYFSNGSIFDLHFGGTSTGVKVFGEKVSEDEFTSQFRVNLVNAALQFGPVVFGDEKELQNARLNVPIQLGALKMAEQRGIQISKQDVDRAMVMTFSIGDKFSEDMLNSYLKKVLNPAGLGAEDLREAYKETLMSSYLDNELAQTFLFSETDNLDATMARAMHAGYKLSVVKFNASDYLAQAAGKITEEQLKTYYEANPEKFEIPAEYEAVVAVLPYGSAAITKAAANTVTEAELKNFFTANSHSYASEGNPNPVFAQVRDRVVKDYISATAQKLANTTASALTGALYENAESSTPSLEKFRDEAAKHGFSFKNTGRYNSKSNAIALKDGAAVADPQLVKLMTEVSAQNPLTNPYAGADAIYIGYAREVAAKSAIPFDKARTQIAALLSHIAAVAIAREEANARASAIASLPYDQRSSTFDLLGKVEKVERGGNLIFDYDSNDNPNLLDIVCTEMEVGDVSAALPTADGAQVVRLDAMTVSPVPAGESGYKRPYLRASAKLMEVYKIQYLGDKIEVPGNFFSAEE